MQGTQVSRAVTLPWPNVHTGLCVFWLREHNGVARIGEMYESLDLLTFTSILTSILTVMKMVPT